MAVRISRGVLLVLLCGAWLLGQHTTSAGIESLNAAQDYLRRGNLAGAKRELRRLVDSNRQDLQAYNLLALVCDETGRPSQRLNITGLP